MLNYKKGVGDAIMIIMVCFVLFITILVVSTVINAVGENAAFQTGAPGEIITSGKNFMGSLNLGFAMIFFALNVYALIMLFFLDSHPVLFIVHLLFLPITILIGAALSNAAEVVIDALSASAAFTIPNFIMLNLPLLMFGFDILGGILLYTVLKGAR